MKFENKPKGINMEQYKTISLQLWGGIPVDMQWATNTNSYKEKLNDKQN